MSVYIYDIGHSRWLSSTQLADVKDSAPVIGQLWTDREEVSVGVYVYYYKYYTYSMIIMDDKIYAYPNQDVWNIDLLINTKRYSFGKIIIKGIRFWFEPIGTVSTATLRTYNTKFSTTPKEYSLPTNIQPFNWYRIPSEYGRCEAFEFDLESFKELYMIEIDYSEIGA
jgi:hypothetical protein